MIFETDVGFRDKSAAGTLETLRQMCEHGEVVETARMKYLKWAVGEGLELWTRFKDGEPEPLFSPYYAGEARMKVALIEKTPRDAPAGRVSESSGSASPRGAARARPRTRRARRRARGGCPARRACPSARRPPPRARR